MTNSLLAGPSLWWRGLKLAWQARWPFWIPVSLALYSSIRLLPRLGDKPLHEQLGLGSLREYLPLHTVGACALTALQAASFDQALHLWGLPALLVTVAFALALWRFFVTNPRPQSKRLALLVAVVSATVAAWIPVAAATPDLTELGRVARSLAREDRMALALFLAPVINLALWRELLSVVLATAALACLGLVFRGAAAGGKRRPWAGLERAGRSFWALFVYCFVKAAFGLWLAFFWWGFARLQTADISFTVEHTVLEWVNQRLYGVELTAIVLANLLLMTVAFPFPFLVLSGTGSVREALRHLVSLWRRRPKPVVSLWLVTVVPMAALGAGSFVAGWMSGHEKTFTAMLGVGSLLILVVGIGGCMGMFLLIEEWRAGMNGDLVRERQPSSAVLTAEVDASSQAGEE